MDDWLYEREKKNKEKELDHCFRELMELCGKLRRKYSEIPDAVFQEYLNSERTEKDRETRRKYPNLEKDLTAYMEKKRVFFSLCEDLDQLDWDWDDDYYDGYHINIKGHRINTITGKEEK